MKLYTDGGVIVRNPSSFGGTYAFIIVDDGKEVFSKAGVYTLVDMGTSAVTNNQMELLAVLLGMEYAHAKGIKIREIMSDSQVTLGRLYQGWKLKNIPDWMVTKMGSVSLRGTRGTFIRGHNGNRWNEKADSMATEAALNFLEQFDLIHLISKHKQKERSMSNGRKSKQSPNVSAVR